MFPDISLLFDSFYQAFDWNALSWLSLESYLLLWVCIFWVTLGLVKTAGTQGIETIFTNYTAKYVVLFVLMGAVFLGIYRGNHLSDSVVLLNDMFVMDNWVNWAQLGIVILSILFVAMTDGNSFTRNSYYYELLLFGLTVVTLMVWLVSTWNFITFYLVLEGISLIFYVLAMRTFTYGGVESGLKYYSLGALASVLLLAGLLSIFAVVGSLDYSVVALAVKSMLSMGDNSLLLVIGLTLVMLAVFFKLSAFPAHVWTPAVYTGTTLEVLWIFAVLAKYSLFIVFMRLLILFFAPALTGDINFWIATSCLGSLIIGAVGAFLATNIKGFIAYTAINQMGFLFIGLVAASFDGIKATMSYLFIYMLANVLFFGIVTLLQSKKLISGELNLRSLKDVSVIKKAPIEMGLAAISLLSMGGLPPLAGFIGKYSLWISLLNKYLAEGTFGLYENLLYILVVSIVLSLLSTFYYLRLIKMALFDNFNSNGEISIEIRNMGEILLSIGVVAMLGAAVIGWVFMLQDLDVIWTQLSMSLVAAFTNVI